MDFIRKLSQLLTEQKDTLGLLCVFVVVVVFKPDPQKSLLDQLGVKFVGSFTGFMFCFLAQTGGGERLDGE